MTSLRALPNECILSLFKPFSIRPNKKNEYVSGNRSENLGTHIFFNYKNEDKLSNYSPIRCMDGNAVLSN